LRKFVEILPKLFFIKTFGSGLAPPLPPAQSASKLQWCYPDFVKNMVLCSKNLLMLSWKTVANGTQAL